MAIVYGPYDGRARHGIDISMSPSAVTKDTSSVTLTYKVYLQTDRGATPGYSGTYTLNRTGTGPTGSSSVSVYTYAQTPQLLGTWTQNVSTSYSGTVSRSLTVQFATALFDGARPSATVSFTVPKRPPQAPSAPTSASATYVSDARIDVAWTRPSNANNAGTIWSNVDVYRKANDGPFVRVAVLPGTATSWSDRTTSANSKYRYAIRGRNSTDDSDAATASDVSTTPAAPSAVAAAKDSSGNIVVTWQDNSAAETGFEVQDETTAVGSPSSSPFTHVGPNPASTHRYRVRAVAAGPRYSAWSAYSNTVQLQAAPAAPDDLAPNGATVDAAGTLTLSWSHNPVDTSPQTAYELDHRLVGAGTWTTASGTTSSSRTLTGYSAGDDVEWRVRTKGAHVDWSPYSATATFSLASKPTATLSSPGATVTEPAVTVTWAYYQADGQAQTGWEVQVLSGATLVAAGSGSGATGTWTSGNVLADGGSYTAKVRVRAASGLWSEWDEQAFTVDYLEPAESSVMAAWQDGYGNVLVTAQAVSDGVSPATVSHSIERSTDGGNTWAVLAEDLSTDASFIDWEAPAGGTYHYRVSAVSALPSMARTVVEVTVPATRINDTIWISGGPGFALAYALPHNPDLDFDGGRDRTLHSFAGRTLPVEFSARTVPTTLSVSATFMPDHYTPSPGDPVMATRADLEDIFSMPGPHLYRDPLGRVLYGTVSSLRWSRSPGGLGSVSFSITRSAPPTSSQAASMQGYFAPRVAEVSPGVYQLIGSDVVEAEPGVFEEIG